MSRRQNWDNHMCKSLLISFKAFLIFSLNLSFGKVLCVYIIWISPLSFTVFVSTRGRSTCTEERSTPLETCPVSSGFSTSRTRPGSFWARGPRISTLWWGTRPTLCPPSRRGPAPSCWCCLDTVLCTVTSARCRSTTSVSSSWCQEAAEFLKKFSLCTCHIQPLAALLLWLISWPECWCLNISVYNNRKLTLATKMKLMSFRRGGCVHLIHWPRWQPARLDLEVSLSSKSQSVWENGMN